MKKKLLIIFALICVLAISATILIACKKPQQHTISFVTGTSQVIEDMTVTVGEQYTLPTPSERDGYTFVGWYNGETKYESGVWSGTSDITLTAHWERTVSEGLTFELNQDSTGYICTGIGTFTGETLVLPSKYNNLPVIGIADNAFEMSDNIRYVFIPSSVKSVGQLAFYNCANLLEIEIPDSVTSIGASAFAECTSLKSFVVPSNLTVIPSNMLLRCKNLTSLQMSDSVVSIGDYAFFGCSKLTNLTFSKALTNVGKYVLTGCIRLESLTLPFVGATKDGTENRHFGYLFGATTHEQNSTAVPVSLKSVTVTNTDKINEYAFYQCSNIQKIILSDSVTVIEKFAFYQCNRLMEIDLGNSVYSIGKFAFSSCIDLLSITIPHSMKSIDALAFENCFKLVEIYNLSDLDIKDGSEDNGYIAYYTNNVYNYVPTESCFVVQGDFVFYKYNNQYYFINYIGQDKDIVLPDKVDGQLYNIYNFAMYTTTLTSVVIPEGVTSIAQYAFGNCKSLESVTIPSSVVSIDDFAFFFCTSLATVTIPDNVIEIGENAFFECAQLTSVVIGSQVSTIDVNAFSGCALLKDVYFNGTEEQWMNISVASGNSTIKDATRYYYSATNPFEGEGAVTSGNYWHYVDGVVTIWQK